MCRYMKCNKKYICMYTYVYVYVCRYGYRYVCKHMCICVCIRDVKRNPENWISVLETKSGSTPSANEIQIYLFFHFRQENYINLIYTFV